MCVSSLYDYFMGPPVSRFGYVVLIWLGLGWSISVAHSFVRFIAFHFVSFHFSLSSCLVFLRSVSTAWRIREGGYHSTGFI